MHDLEIARKFASTNRRQELEVALRQLTEQLERSKSAAMLAEGLAAE
jgi:hypothetical protein